MVGQNIGKYRVLDRIGRGGMGTVYRAVDETLHRDVAIKVLNAELNDPEVARRFRGEAITVARLSHPGIATIYELFQHDGQWLMVMEFVRGETLERLVERAGPLAPERTADLCMQVLAALAHAHSMGVVHRDLKPANIMLTEGGVIKVMDFGIARVAGTEHLTNAGFMMGTPAYMAPEQVMGKEIDARADLYAIGVMFYRLTAGKLPFTGDTPFAMAQSQVYEPPVPITTIRSGLPGWVDEVLTRALAKSPDQRFQSAVEFYEALSRCLDGQPIPAPYTSAAPTELLHTPGRAMPTGGLGRPATPPSMPPLTGRAPDPTPLSQPIRGVELEPTVLAQKPGGPALSGPVPSTAGAALVTPTPAESPSPLASGQVTVRAPTAPVDVVAESRNAAEPNLADAPAAQFPPSAPPAAPSSRVWFMVAAAVVLVGGLGAWFALRGSPTPPAAPPANDSALAPASGGAPAPLASDTATAPAPVPAAPEPALSAGTTAVPPGDSAGAPVNRPAARAARTAAAARGGPSAPPAAPVEVPLSVANAKLFVVTERNKTSDQDATLNFADGQISVLARRSGDLLASMPYAAILKATYIKARDPKWDTSMPGPPANLDVGGMLRTSKHWIVLQGSDRYLILRLEDSNWRPAYEAVRSRTGLTINLPANNEKP